MRAFTIVSILAIVASTVFAAPVAVPDASPEPGCRMDCIRELPESA